MMARRMRGLARRNGQGMLEYVLVLTMILVAILASLSVFQATFDTEVLGVAEKQITQAGDKFKLK